MMSLENRFGPHPSFGTQDQRYKEIRDGCLALARLIDASTRTSTDKELAFQALDEVMFRAHASIARNEVKPVPILKLGINLAGVVDWNTEIPFNDIFLTRRDWTSNIYGGPYNGGPKLVLTSDGYPQSLAENQFAEAMMFVDIPGRYPVGEYDVTWDGEGVIEWNGALRGESSKTGTRRVISLLTEPFLALRIKKTNPNNPIRNVKFIKTGTTELFNRKFTARWSGVEAVRFMDWQNTNNSPISEWDDKYYSGVGLRQTSASGVALKNCLSAAMQMDSRPWLCIPHLATDNYVRKMATMIAGQGLNPIIEYSNECWNRSFKQAQYCIQQGRSIGGSNEYENQLRWYSQRSVEVFKIFADVLGRGNTTNVLSTHHAHPWTSEVVLNWQDAYKWTNALAVAPYFGSNISPYVSSGGNVPQPLTVDEVLDKCMDAVNANKSFTSHQFAIANGLGLKLFAYEGGQHLVGDYPVFIEANRHPRMGEIYKADVDNWMKCGGDLYCAFSSMTKYNKYGSWGLLEHMEQDVLTAPKYMALMLAAKMI